MGSLSDGDGVLEKSKASFNSVFAEKFGQTCAKELEKFSADRCAERFIERLDEGFTETFAEMVAERLRAAEERAAAEELAAEQHEAKKKGLRLRCHSLICCFRWCRT